MANDEQRNIPEGTPPAAEEQEHEGSFAPSEQNPGADVGGGEPRSPGAHPEDTDNLEHDHQAVYGAAPADGSDDDGDEGGEDDGDAAGDAAGDEEDRQPMDFPRAQADSTEALSGEEAPETTHPDLQNEVGLPDPEAPRSDDVRPLNDDGVSGHAQPGYPEGAEYSTGASVEPASAPVTQQADPVGNATNPISRRDVDGVAGQFVDIVAGDHTGRFGHYVNTVSRDEDGVPETVLIRTRDARNELLEVAYSDVRPSERNGGR